MSSQNLGIRKSARSPGSIINEQNHDPSNSQKSANGMPGTIKQVVADSTVATVIQDFALLWVVNRDTSPHYLSIAKDSDIPASVTASNGLCVPAGEGMLIMCGASDDDKKSMACKADNALVHITVLEA